MILLSISILLFVAYSVLVISYWQTWTRIPEYHTGVQKYNRKISIIIPARNEEQNIKRLLGSLEKQSYPRYLTEVIVVDDHSTDDTAAAVHTFDGVILLQLAEDSINSYKKKAIETGIKKATGDFIITTDADCVAGPDWLKTIALFKEENNSVFIAAPVCFITDPSSKNKWLLHFQVLDFQVLQGITGAAVYNKSLSMCNGANLAYEKKVFNEVNGFRGIDHIASGDDMLLMHKIRKQYPGYVHYVKSRDAIIYTQAAKSWREFFNQRIRWASKAGKYEDTKIVWVLLLVYLFNFSFLVLFVSGFWNHNYWWYVLGLWVAKTMVEYPFVDTLAAFFNTRSLMKYFFLFQPFHILYTILAGWLGQIGKYEWKGRIVK